MTKTMVTCHYCPRRFAADDPGTLLHVLVDHFVCAHPDKVEMLIRLLASLSGGRRGALWGTSP